MADWVTYDNDTGRVETHVMDKLGNAFRGATGSLHDLSEDTKKNSNSAMLVGGVGGLVGFTLGFWGIKMMLEKVGMDGFFGSTLSLVGAITLGLAVFNLLSNKNADSRAVNAQREWAATHPQGDKQPFKAERGSLKDAVNEASGVSKDNEETGRPFETEREFQRTRRNNPDLFPPAPGVPENVSVSVESSGGSSPSLRLPGLSGP